jgi:hypothetical protein
MKRIALKSMRLWMLAAICLLALQSQGQTPRKVTFSNFTMQEDVMQYDKGITGLVLKYDVYLNWEDTEVFSSNFNVSFRLVQAGVTILESSKMNRSSRTFMAHSEQVGGKPGMAARGQRDFIPFTEIPLEAGPQKAEIIFSLSNNLGTYTDCFKTTLSWNHKKVVRHDLNEQVFVFKNIQTDYAAKSFAHQDLGMLVHADMDLKYGPEECMESSYQMAFLLNRNGTTVYDSRKAKSMSSDKTKSVSVELKDQKPSARTSFFVDYHDLSVEGPTEVEVVFVMMGAEGGPKEVHRQTMTLDLPLKYNFEEQKFNLHEVVVEPSTRDGVQGISVNFACGFKHASVMRNPDRGDYYFYLALYDGNGKLVVDPKRAPTIVTRTSHLLDGHLPSPADSVAQGQLFIPYYMLTTAAGSHDLKYKLMVSDKNLGTNFPVVGQGTVAVQKPEERMYYVSLQKLQMIDANYDAEFLSVNGHLPELQYLFCVGEDAFYESNYSKNSLSAVPGSVILRCSAGDELMMKLYDVDSGFFNASDLQGKWKLDYAVRGEKFDWEVKAEGQVEEMLIRVERK